MSCTPTTSGYSPVLLNSGTVLLPVPFLGWSEQKGGAQTWAATCPQAPTTCDNLLITMPATGGGGRPPGLIHGAGWQLTAHQWLAGPIFSFFSVMLWHGMAWQPPPPWLAASESISTTTRETCLPPYAMPQISDAQAAIHAAVTDMLSMYACCTVTGKRRQEEEMYMPGGQTNRREQRPSPPVWAEPCGLDYHTCTAHHACHDAVWPYAI